MKLFLRSILIVLIALTLTGCVSSLKNIKESLGVEETKAIMPPRSGPIELPSHAKLAIAGLIQHMRHKPLAGITFDPAGTHLIREGFDYDGFDLIHTDIAKYHVVKETLDTSTQILGGFLHFIDGSARRTVVAFEVGYRRWKKVDKPPLILRSVVSTVLPQFPAIATFYVPAESFEYREGGKPKTFVEYLDHAMKYGIEMRATGEDIAKHNKELKLSTWDRMKKSFSEGDPGKEYELVVLTFCFDRLGENSKLNLKLSGISDYSAITSYSPFELDFDGWRIVALSGTARLFSPAKSFNIEVSFNPDPSTQLRTEKIASYSSLKFYPEDAPKAPDRVTAEGANQNMSNTTRTEASTQTAASGTISRGARLLDVKKFDDAVLVQSRLKALGYYNSTVDGAFGANSKKALKAWASANVGLEIDILTIDIQKKLFEGTGL
ncbi:MAG: hypothetical protein C0608_01030 [Deltaproteobacteria bacterium]|nr:MAG: hypothetical protein C0608_01030 [Deltaproteobacteria bacterium]